MFSQLRKVKKIFFYFFRDLFYLWETMNHTRMILKHLCLIGMIGIIQSKIIWGYLLLPLLCSMSLISPNVDVKSIVFPNFSQGPFPQIAEKRPVQTGGRLAFWHIQWVAIECSRYKYILHYYFANSSNLPYGLFEKTQMIQENEWNTVDVWAYVMTMQSSVYILRADCQNCLCAM